MCGAQCAALKRGKDALKVVCLNSRAGIDHFKFGEGTPVVNDEMDAASLGELDGVRQQIDQDLAQTLFVGIHHDRQHRRPFENELGALGGSLQTEHSNELIEKLA